MVGKYKVITLCGSTRFKEEFMEAQKELTLDGYIVISVGLFGHAGDDEVWEGMPEDTITKTKEMLDDMHLRKIDMADAICVINVNGYFGDSTKSEISYALATGKEVLYLEPDKPYEPAVKQQVMEGFESLLPEADDIIELLEYHGVTYVDKRSTGGALWIIGGRELGEVVQKAKTLGTHFQFKEGGGKISKGKDAWWSK